MGSEVRGLAGRPAGTALPVFVVVVEIGFHGATPTPDCDAEGCRVR